MVRLIVPFTYYVEGGVERVMLSLLKEFSNLAEEVVILLPHKAISKVKSGLLDASGIVYESTDWPVSSVASMKLRLLGYLHKIARATRSSALIQWIEQKNQDIQSVGRIRSIAKKYKCTHCLYFISNRVPTPKELKIPVITLCHDLFWHFAPLTYKPDLVKQYDNSLQEWLSLADLVITVSEKTRSDLLKVFPGFEYKVKAIPSASDRPKEFPSEPTSALATLKKYGLEAEQTITFFFPSSFSLYKDHLTLIQAGIKTYHSERYFKILLTGKDTDRLANGNLALAKQKKTMEYKSYISQLQQLYSENEDIWHSILFGFGYCDLAIVEAVYQTCNCVVMPSQYEGFGLPISEAIVRGIPIIAADIEVFHEQVELYKCSDLVRFFQPGNADSLRDCLNDFIDHPSPRLSNSEASARFGHWTWRHVAETYIRELSAL